MWKLEIAQNPEVLQNWRVQETPFSGLHESNKLSKQATNQITNLLTNQSIN